MKEEARGGAVKEVSNMELENPKKYHGQVEKEVEEKDQIIEAIGHFGKWQLKYFIIVGLITLPTAFPVLSIVFTAASTDFWCSIPQSLEGRVNSSAWINMSSPLKEDGSHDLCHVWDVQDPEEYLGGNAELVNRTKSCQAWDYDRSLFQHTILQHYDLVCDRDKWKNTSQAAYFLGMIIGVFAAGWLADSFGRKTVLIPIVILASVFGSATAFMPTIQGYIALRFLTGLVNIGIFLVGFVWCIETVGGKWQTIVGIGFEAPWVVAWFLTALVAHLFPDWRHFQLVTSIPMILCGLGYWFLPESPKWLLANGKIDQAEDLVREAVEMNGRTLPTGWRLQPLDQDDQGVGKSSNPTVFHLFTRPHLATKTLILYFNWFANSFVYYGLTLNSEDIGGSVMMNFLLGGFTEIPAYLFSLWILLKKGRKIPYAGMMLTGGIALFCTLAVPRDVYVKNWPVVVLVMIGKLCITGKKASISLLSLNALCTYLSQMYFFQVPLPLHMCTVPRSTPPWFGQQEWAPPLSWLVWVD